MSFWKALNRPMQLAILGALGALLLGGGVVLWQVLRPDLPEAAGQGADAVLAPDTSAADTQVMAAPPPAEPATDLALPEPPSDLPRIDTWRVAPDGEALVAGLAAPDATVAVLVDGTGVAAGEAGSNGEFVLLFTLAPRLTPGQMGLTMTLPSGEVITSTARVVLGPIRGPDPAPDIAVSDPVSDPEGAPETLATAADAATEPQALPETQSAAADPPPAIPEPAVDAAPVGLLVSDEGAVILQGEKPDAAEVTIDTITYTPEGAVQIGGRGTAGAGLRLYLDNAALAELAVSAGGTWLTTLGDIDPGTYLLRVDQLDSTGAVVARFETPFKRESLETLAALTAPPAPTVAEAATPPAPPELPQPTSADPPAAEPAPPQPDLPDLPRLDPEAIARPTVVVTVQPGFTLWGIAEDTYGEGVLYVQLFQANADQIRDPDLIYPGQVFRLPESAAP